MNLMSFTSDTLDTKYRISMNSIGSYHEHHFLLLPILINMELFS